MEEFMYILVGIILIILVFSSYNRNYEGQTAKEWFYMYDASDAAFQELKDCISDNPTEAYYCF